MLRHAAIAVLASGCMGPLVEDTPGASAHLLPSGSRVPSVAENADLTSQLLLNDGLEDTVVTEAGGMIPREDGAAPGVKYWSFGPARPAPSPLYVFYEDTGAGLRELDHPPLVDGMPGDPAYSAAHTIYRVVVTPAYAGQLVTNMEALADALELGLILEPELAGLFVASPVVFPGTTLEVGGAAPVQAEPVYGRGHAAAMFRFGGMRGLQPLVDLVPTRQVTFVREAMKADYASRPIFQATVPATAPTTLANYTPVSVVVRVDLMPGVAASSITSDDQLFMRAGDDIVGTTGVVSRFEITTSLRFLQLQFEEGSP